MAVEVNTKQPVYQSNPQTSPTPGEPPPPQDPQYCECAKIGKRSLSWAPWLGILSKNDGSYLDRHNLEIAHEHIFFEQSKDNVGFSPQGLFQEDVESQNYRFDERCYDGTAMRETLRRIGDAGPYNFFKNNCQDFMARVKETYSRLSKW
jgi:hypothetical protein